MNGDPKMGMKKKTRRVSAHQRGYRRLELDRDWEQEKREEAEEANQFFRKELKKMAPKTNPITLAKLIHEAATIAREAVRYLSQFDLADGMKAGMTLTAGENALIRLHGHSLMEE